MIDLRKIDEIVTRLSDSLPPGAAQLQEDIEAQFRAVLKKAFERMELVTREEFDEQKAVLERTRVRLEALQSQLAELEG
jgi:BMFP domain-containing protein YqiC